MTVANVLLEVDAIESGYGKKTVLQGVGLRVHEGEVVAVLGHNGAGKSTALKTILGLLPTRAGMVRFAGEPWANGDPAENVRRGMALVPQGRFKGRDEFIQFRLRRGCNGQERVIQLHRRSR